jgi:hypothetical protein
MNLEKRIESFSDLGKILRNSLDGKDDRKLGSIIEDQQHKNHWFTPGNVRFALESIAAELTEENLLRWTSAYPVLKEDMKPVNVGLIFAGNIPLAGFHDFLTVLISGNRVMAKTSSKDPDLISWIGETLTGINPEFSSYIEFTTGILRGFDAVIATGSNNSSRYFEYYFSKYPHIIRKNRNSIAILGGDETSSELTALGEDIFTYFGLGCRNVSKIYVPEDYDVSELEKFWKRWSHVKDHSAWANNYDYNKAIYLVNRQKFHDAEFLLMRENQHLASPVSVLHYEYYSNAADVDRETERLKENIQCIAGRNHIPFGRTQMPHLWEYADGKDTLEFLLKKNLAGIL